MQIGLFNINNQLFKSQATLKDQACKHFFYGKDGVLEDNFSKLEGDFASAVNRLTDTLTIPGQQTLDHYLLRSFMTTTLLRGPAEINHIKAAPNVMERIIKENSPQWEYTIPEISHEEALGLALHGMQVTTEVTYDLKMKILINQTSTPFITSDYPFIRYNSFLEQKKWPLAKTGYAVKGLKIFMPLNSSTMLIMYDSDIYKVGGNKGNSVVLNEKDDIDQLNLLQVLNCSDQLYFNHQVTKEYITGLFKRSLKFVRGKRDNSYSSVLVGLKDKPVMDATADARKNLIIMGESESDIRLQLKFLKIHSKGKSEILSDSAAKIRKRTEYVISKYHAKYFTGYNF